jgi:putative transposon-encoded protein
MGLAESSKRFKCQHGCYNVDIFMREIDYNYIKSKVTKHGNGAKVLVPKELIGEEVYVIPIDVWNNAQLDSIMKGHSFRVLRGRRKK